VEEQWTPEGKPAGKIVRLFDRDHVREFGGEYGPMIVEPPSFDLIENWNHWYTLAATLLAIAVFVGVSYYQRQQQAAADAAFAAGCHLFIDTIGTGPGKWQGVFDFRDCSTLLAGIRRPMLKIASSKQESDLMVCITVGAGLYAFFNARDQQLANADDATVDQFRRACEMFLFGVKFK